MTVEANIYNALKSLVANRVFPDVGPLGTAAPYITYQQIGGAVVQPLAGGLADKQNGRFQVNVWAKTRSEAASLALLVESAMVGASTFQARAVGAPSATYDGDVTLYGSIQDFSVWSAR